MICFLTESPKVLKHTPYTKILIINNQVNKLLTPTLMSLPYAKVVDTVGGILLKLAPPIYGATLCVDPHCTGG